MFLIAGAIPADFLPTIISASAVILGAILGGICSWIVTQKATHKTIAEQKRIVSETRACEESEKRNKISENATIIRLDLCTALFQSIRAVKNLDKEIQGVPIPMNKEYAKTVASLKNEFTLKEMSYIYQLYGVIEKLNTDIKNVNLLDKESHTPSEIKYEIFLKKLYGQNYKEVAKVDIEAATYSDLYSNPIMKEGYRIILEKLDKL